MESFQNHPAPKLISLTLPVACQICLGKVKEPVVCPNQHVFCSVCMDVWLRTNKQCPTCRTPITPEQPCKKIVGSLDTAETPPDAEVRANLRRTRLDLIRQDYEEEITSLQSANDDLREENQNLLQQIDNFKSLARHGARSPVSEGELDTLMKLTAKLQEASGTYDALKLDLRKLKQENDKLRSANVQLMGENAKLREDSSFNKSPHKFSRYTVVALQAKVDLYEREIQQLKRALERSDQVIDQLKRGETSTDVTASSIADSAECLAQGISTHTDTLNNSILVNRQSKLKQSEGASSLTGNQRLFTTDFTPKSSTLETRVKNQNRLCCSPPSKRKVPKQHLQTASSTSVAQWSMSHTPSVSSCSFPVHSQASEQSALVSLSSLAQGFVSTENTTSQLDSLSQSTSKDVTTPLNTPTEATNSLLQMKTGSGASSAANTELIPLGITVVPAAQSSFEEETELEKELPDLPADTENRFPAIARLRQLKRALIKDKDDSPHSPHSPFAHSPASSTSGRASTDIPQPDFCDMYSSQLPSPWGKPSMVVSGYTYSPVGTSNPTDNTELPHSTCHSAILENGMKIKTELVENSNCS